MTSLLEQTQDDLPEIDPTKEYLKELVGEGKKFKTPEELARGKYEADHFIETLKRRSDELRADYLKLREESAARAKLEELIDQINKKQQSSNDLPNVNDVKQDKPVMDLKEIESLVDTRMTARERTRKEDENFNSIKAKLRERYGANYANALKDQMESLGLTQEYLDEQARKYPQALVRLLGLDQQHQQNLFQNPPRGSSPFKPAGDKKRPLSYYHELKKTNPRLYYDPKIAVQMDKDSQEMGEAFFDVPE